jgi:hypothetical protein
VVAPPRVARVGLAGVRLRRRTRAQVEGAGACPSRGPVRRPRTHLPPSEPRREVSDERHATPRDAGRGAADRGPGPGPRSRSPRQAGRDVRASDAQPRRPPVRSRQAGRGAWSSGVERVRSAPRALDLGRRLAAARSDPNVDVRPAVVLARARRGRGDRREERAVWGPRRHLVRDPRSRRRALADDPPQDAPYSGCLVLLERSASPDVPGLCSRLVAVLGERRVTVATEPPSISDEPTTISGSARVATEPPGLCDEPTAISRCRCHVEPEPPASPPSPPPSPGSARVATEPPGVSDEPTTISRYRGTRRAGPGDEAPAGSCRCARRLLRGRGGRAACAADRRRVCPRARVGAGPGRDARGRRP